MDAETGAMYAKFTAKQTDQVRSEIDDAFVIDPATMVVTVLALDPEAAVGHAALRPVVSGDSHSSSLEVKKVFVSEGTRGRGVARLLMLEVESIARGRGVESLVLQTGSLQVPAIRLYLDLGYVPIPPFGKYGVIPGALCYERVLSRGRSSPVVS